MQDRLLQSQWGGRQLMFAMKCMNAQRPLPHPSQRALISHPDLPPSNSFIPQTLFSCTEGWRLQPTFSPGRFRKENLTTPIKQILVWESQTLLRKWENTENTQSVLEILTCDARAWRDEPWHKTTDRGTSALSPDTPQPSPTPVGFVPQIKLGCEDSLLGNEKKHTFISGLKQTTKSRLCSLTSLYQPVTDIHKEEWSLHKCWPDLTILYT